VIRSYSLFPPVLVSVLSALHTAPAVRFPPAPQIRVERAFRAEVYARGLVRPTALAFGPSGVLYATQEAGSVVAVRPGTRRPSVVASGFSESTLGLAWRGRTLYVSTKGRLESLVLTRRGRAGNRRVVVGGLPQGLHQQDNVVVHRGRLYFGTGSTCDACAERDSRSATVLSVKPSGRGLQVEARGLRNPFGLAVEPRSGRIYVSVNGRDKLGRGEPAESVVRLERSADYGWPSCWPSWRMRRLVGSCAGVKAPVAYLEPHSSANGLAFERGGAFPARYRRNLFVAEWGQYDSSFSGRKVVRIALRPDGSARAVSTFASGFDHPLAVAFDRLGALLVADWGRGTIYRIQARGKP
jgi:glucose/arabinose dehydrogenase